mmetsp:Transcript_18240/g.17367  ORF Transcript_18240/g.17367 Transcript_18240/m.17367 type:complete len:88 (-) Transcript_18240:206-469(-)
MVQVVSTFNQKALLLHDYDFYVLYFNYFKDKDMQSQFDPPDVALNRKNFAPLQEVIAEDLKNRLEDDEFYSTAKNPFEGYGGPSVNA